MEEIFLQDAKDICNKLNYPDVCAREGVCVCV